MLLPGVTGSLDSPRMTYLSERGRADPPVAGDETATLLGFTGAPARDPGVEVRVTGEDPPG